MAVGLTTFEERFEEGTKGAFNTETDTESRLSYPHYTELARLGRPMPWSGAYCAYFDLAADATEAILTENDGFDLAADGEDYVKFLAYFDLKTDATGTAENFTLWKQISAGGDEGEIEVRSNGVDTFQIGLNEANETAAFVDLPQKKWLQIELARVIDAGTGNDGKLTLYLDDTEVAALSTIDQGAITSAELGYTDSTASPTRNGFFLIDHVIVDGVRQGGKSSRWPKSFFIQNDTHAFVGRGYLAGCSLDDAGGGGDSTITFYDTDVADTSPDRIVWEGSVSAANLRNSWDFSYPGLRFIHGCYCQLGGTTPIANIRLGRCFTYGSEAAIKQHALKWRAQRGT